MSYIDVIRVVRDKRTPDSVRGPFVTDYPEMAKAPPESVAEPSGTGADDETRTRDIDGGLSVALRDTGLV